MSAPSEISTARTSLSSRALCRRSRSERSDVGSLDVTKKENAGGFSLTGPEISMYATFGSASVSFCVCFHCFTRSEGDGNVALAWVVDLVEGLVVGLAD